jgi:hypothetical protein
LPKSTPLKRKGQPKWAIASSKKRSNPPQWH